MFLLSFLVLFFYCHYYSFEYISEDLTFPIDTTHCEIELAFACFVFCFPQVTLCDQPYGVEACVMFSYDII